MLELTAEAGLAAPRFLALAPADHARVDARLAAFSELAAVEGWQFRRAELLAPFGLVAGAGGFGVATVRVTPPFARLDTVVVVVAGDAAVEHDAASRLAQAILPDACERRRLVLGELLLAAVTSNDDPLELTDRAARLFYVNPAWERAFGYGATEVLGNPTGEVLRDKRRPHHDPSFYRFTERSVAKGKTWLGVLTSQSRDGTARMFEVAVSPFNAPDVAFAGNLALRRDLAHRAERDAALTAAHAQFRAVLAAVPDGVIVLRDGLVYFTNDAFARLVGANEASVIGHRFDDFVHPDDRWAFREREPSTVTPLRMLHSAGEPRYAEISAAGAISFEAEPAVILIARDVTERRRTEERLALAERLSALGELAAGVAHELNNPLSFVVMNLELARAALERPGAPGTREALDEALDGTRRMQGITAELRSFSAADRPAPPEPVSLSAVVTSAVNIVQNEIRHRAELVRELTPDLYVLAREGQLVQVLVNLLVNAAHAIPDDGAAGHRITISAQPAADGVVRFEVQDTGTGVEPELLPRLFEPFSTTKPRGKDSGLGLTISRRIVDGLGGSIRASANEPRGTRVTVELPRANPPSPRALQAAEPPKPRAERRRRVLVIDDEPAIGRALRRVLHTHEVVLAENGEAGIACLLAEGTFDIVFCDLMMPGISGTKVFDAVCASRPELQARFVFMTGGTTGELRAGLPAGVRLLFKPYGNADVLSIVDEILPDGS